MNGTRAAWVAAGIDAVAAAVILVLVGQVWQVARVDRPAPLGAVTAGLTGRLVEPAVAGFALVGLAGAVAALATRGLARRAVGVVVSLSAVIVVFQAIAGMALLAAPRARELIAESFASGGGTPVAAPVPDGSVTVVSHPQWAALSASAAVLMLAAGLIWTFSGRRTQGLPSRYEPPVQDAGRGDVTLWSALDRGDDPTADADADGAQPAPVPGAPVTPHSR